MTASKRHSINGAKVQGVSRYVCVCVRACVRATGTPGVTAVALGACLSLSVLV